MKKIICIIIFFIFCISSTNFAYGKTLKNKSYKFFIYNSHPYENYSNGENIKVISERLNNRLTEIGVNSAFLDYTEGKHLKSYSGAKKLIKEKVKNFNNSSLIDIHISGNMKICKNDIEIYIAKGNPNYTKNEEFAKKLVSSIKALNNNLSVDIIMQDNVKYNQDLSDKAILIMLNSTVGKDDLNKIIDTLTYSIKNVSKI
jgi:stage II sporulation protein P